VCSAARRSGCFSIAKSKRGGRKGKRIFGESRRGGLTWWPGVEGDEAFAVGVGDVDAGFLDGAEVEAVGVDELDDEDAEEVLVAELFGGEDLGEAAEQLAEGGGLGGG
jgi:hypothetical protein